MDAATAFGQAAEILMATDRRDLSLRSIYSFLRPPIMLGQITFVVSQSAFPTAYGVWAFLTEPVMRSLATGERRALQLCEWNEGTHLTVLDVVAPMGQAAQALRQIRALCPEHRTIHWFRHDRRQAQGLRSTSLRP